MILFYQNGIGYLCCDQPIGILVVHDIGVSFHLCSHLCSVLASYLPVTTTEVVGKVIVNKNDYEQIFVHQ